MERRINMPEDMIFESLCRQIGRTVTIFTTSGGISGSGFTGVLAAVTQCAVKLITDIGLPPACPVGSSCTFDNGCGRDGFDGRFGGFGSGFGFGGFAPIGCRCGGCCRRDGFCGGRDGGFDGGNWLGSVTEIPIDKIACFTHNAI